MKIFFAVVILLFSIPMSSQPEKRAAMQNSDETQATSMLADIHSVSPALERYTRDRLFGELWKRPDRSRPGRLPELRVSYPADLTRSTGCRHAQFIHTSQNVFHVEGSARLSLSNHEKMYEQSYLPPDHFGGRNRRTGS
jgi:hypothetical protein